MRSKRQDILRKFNGVSATNDPPSIIHLENFLYDERCYLLAASVNHEVVGFILAYRFPSFHATENVAYLYDLEVLPQNRRSGIGRSLVNEMISELKADNVKEIWLGTAIENVAAQNLFNSTGAQKEEETFYEYIYFIP